MRYSERPWTATLTTLLSIASVGCGDSTVGPETGLVESSQLLENAGMETSAIPWWPGGNSPSDFAPSWSNREAVSGIGSLSLRGVAGSTAFFSFWAQTIEVDDPTGMTLELSVAVKVADIDGEGIALAIRADDTSLSNGESEGFATTRSAVLIDGTRDWTTHSVELSGLAPTIDRITVYLMYLPNTSGTVYFDDAVLSASR